MIAGSGEQKTLRLVVRYGDEIEETSSVNFNVGEDGSKTGELIEHLHRLADIGIETVFGRVAYAERITRIEIMGREVIPVVAEF